MTITQFWKQLRNGISLTERTEAEMKERWWLGHSPLPMLFYVDEIETAIPRRYEQLLSLAKQSHVKVMFVRQWVLTPPQLFSRDDDIASE